MLRLIPLSLLIGFCSIAQTPTPPGQPLTGPGGKDYLYRSYQKLGPYYVNPADPQPYASFYVYEPTGGTPPASLPVVLFLHGYLISGEGYPNGDSPSNYAYWLVHLARMGYTVVFPAYDDNQYPREFTIDIIQSWGAAVALLQSGGSGLIPPSSDSLGIQTVFAGHSMGAYQAFAVTQLLTGHPVAGVPIPRAIAAFAPSVGNSGLPKMFKWSCPTVSVVVAHGDEDVANTDTVMDIWNSISNVIPPANRDLLEVVSDSHGLPAQLGNHYFPDTSGFKDDDPGVDDRDYNVTWKLSVGLFNCVLYGTDCSYGLGHGSTDQINMGNWSDGTPVTPLLLQNTN